MDNPYTNISQPDAGNIRPEDADLHAAIKSLRAKVDMLLSLRVAPAVASAFDSAETEAHRAVDFVQGGIDELSGMVRQRPCISILCAALAGYFFAGICRR